LEVMRAIDLKILLCVIPSGTLHDGITEQPSYNAPLGILRVADGINKKGFNNIVLYDINSLRPDDDELREKFEDIRPDVVGLSGVLSHCYPNLKRIAKILRDLFPNIWIVVGGNIASSAHVFLKTTEADICVVGDGEIAFTNLLTYILSAPTNKEKKFDKLGGIKGLAFYDDKNSFYFTGFGEQIPENELEFPDLDVMKTALLDKQDRFIKYFPPISKTKIINQFFFDQNNIFFDPNLSDRPKPESSIFFIPTCKGCVAKCTFCQRYTKGYRKYNLENLEAYARRLKEEYNVHVFITADENFGSNKVQAYQFADIMKKVGIYWMVLGARCKSFDLNDLKYFKERYMFGIAFGMESGSAKMLDIMEKKFTPDDVLEAVSNCHRLGLYTFTDSMLLGMPGETEETVVETSRFVAKLRHIVGLNNNISAPSWAMAIPGTPLYEFAQQIGVLGNSLEREEMHLCLLAEESQNIFNHVNLNGGTVEDIYYWSFLYTHEGRKFYLELILNENILVRDKIAKVYKFCIKYFLDYYIERITGCRSSIYDMKGGRFAIFKYIFRAFSFFLATIRFISVIGNLLLPRSITRPIMKQMSVIYYYFIEKKMGKENILFVQRGKPHKACLVTDVRLQRYERQVERSLRKIVKENRLISSTSYSVSSPYIKYLDGQ